MRLNYFNLALPQHSNSNLDPMPERAFTLLIDASANLFDYKVK